MAGQQLRNINDVFFKGFYKEVWRKMIPPGLTQAEADLIQDVAGLKSGDKVLDIMCGYGRHSIELAKRGLPVTAVDNLQDYISEIEMIAQQNKLPVTPICCSATELNPEGTFNAALCMGNSFSFFTYDDAFNIVKKTAAHLTPGATFIINSWMIAETVIRDFKEKAWHYVDEYKYLMDCRYLLHPTRIESEHIIIAPDGEIEILNGIDYIFSFSELDAMFTNAGFFIKDVFSTTRKKHFKLGDKTAYVIAQKR